MARTKNWIGSILGSWTAYVRDGTALWHPSQCNQSIISVWVSQSHINPTFKVILQFHSLNLLAFTTSPSSYPYFDALLANPNLAFWFVSPVCTTILNPLPTLSGWTTGRVSNCSDWDSGWFCEIFGWNALCLLIWVMRCALPSLLTRWCFSTVWTQIHHYTFFSSLAHRFCNMPSSSSGISSFQYWRICLLNLWTMFLSLSLTVKMKYCTNII